MKELWNNEWFKLGTVLTLFFITAVSPPWGATIVFFYFGFWMWNKQMNKQL